MVYVLPFRAVHKRRRCGDVAIAELHRLLKPSGLRLGVMGQSSEVGHGSNCVLGWFRRLLKPARELGAPS